MNYIAINLQLIEMKKVYLIILAFLTILLVGCAGTGTKNLASLNHHFDTSGESKVFVIRDNAYVGSAVVMVAHLNNIAIGEIGAGEMIVAKTVPGKNTLKIRMGGLIGEESSISFMSNGKDHNFFLARLQSGLFSAELKITETTENSWKLESTQNK